MFARLKVSVAHNMVRHDIPNDPTNELHARFARVTTVEYMCMQDKLEGEGATSYGLGYTRGRVRARKFFGGLGFACLHDPPGFSSFV
jgi:hypothetical protein